MLKKGRCTIAAVFLNGGEWICWGMLCSGISRVVSVTAFKM